MFNIEIFGIETVLAPDLKRTLKMTKNAGETFQSENSTIKDRRT